MAATIESLCSDMIGKDPYDGQMRANGDACHWKGLLSSSSATSLVFCCDMRSMLRVSLTRRSSSGGSEGDLGERGVLPNCSSAQFETTNRQF